jgi:hypothetical protein
VCFAALVAAVVVSPRIFDWFGCFRYVAAVVIGRRGASRFDRAELNKSVCAPLVGAAVVVRAQRQRQRFHCVANPLSRQRIEQAFNMQHAVERRRPGQPAALVPLAERTLRELRGDDFTGPIGDDAQLIRVEARRFIDEHFFDLGAMLDWQGRACTSG